MSGEDFLHLFKTASSQWLCDPYSVEIRFIAQSSNSFIKLISCTVHFWPIGSAPSSSQRVYADKIIAGRELITDMSQAELETFINNLEKGNLVLSDLSASMVGTQELGYYSEMISNDRWFCDAHLLIRGDTYNPLSSVEIASINNQLRLAHPPFDGLTDLVNYLNLPDALSGFKQSQIEIRISPPVDIRIDESSLSKGKLRLVIHAHPKFDISNVSLATREFPENTTSRKQVASNIKWKLVKGRQIGTLNAKAKNAFAIQAILMAGQNTVRRQFFEDFQKIPNRRLFAVSNFDKELKRLRFGLNDNNQDSFEKAVNSLAYLLGFSGCVMNESDAPDLILSSPNENLVLVECTTRIADFANKVGKLVDRKNALLSQLNDAGDSRAVHGYLVCGLPKAQIAYDEVYLAKHKITLLTKESLEQILMQLKFPQDLEKLLLDDEKSLEEILLQNANNQQLLAT